MMISYSSTVVLLPAACDSAYGDAAGSIVGACRFGCSSQLPLVKERREQVIVGMLDSQNLAVI